MSIYHNIFVSAAAALLLLAASPALANHAWGNYHWARTANPFTLTLGDNVTSTWDSYLQTTSADWSLSTVLDTNVVSGLGGKTCKSSVGRVEVCNSKYGRNGWLGIASIWISGTHITQGTVKLNDTYFNTSKYNTSAWKNMVMCQEVGHIFGLNHQDEVFDNTNLETCMDYTNSPASNQHPNAHDYKMLEEIYAHLDTTTTVASVLLTNPAQTDSDDPREWGREIRRSEDGHASVYLQDLGNGNGVVRHVFWAEPRAERTERVR